MKAPAVPTPRAKDLPRAGSSVLHGPTFSPSGGRSGPRSAARINLQRRTHPRRVDPATRVVMPMVRGAGCRCDTRRSGTPTAAAANSTPRTSTTSWSLWSGSTTRPLADRPDRLRSVTTREVARQRPEAPRADDHACGIRPRRPDGAPGPEAAGQLETRRDASRGWGAADVGRDGWCPTPGRAQGAAPFRLRSPTESGYGARRGAGQSPIRVAATETLGLSLVAIACGLAAEHGRWWWALLAAAVLVDIAALATLVPPRSARRPPRHRRG